MICEICQIKERIYQDEMGFVTVSANPMAVGHIQVFPIRHVNNLAELTDHEVSHLFYIASFAASALFEGLGVQATNIIMNDSKVAGNNFDHLCINVLPRNFDDGIDLKWISRKFTPAELKEIEDKIKNHTFYIGKESEIAPEKTPMEKLKELNDSYLTRQLDRVP